VSLGNRFPIFQSTVVHRSITGHCWASNRFSMHPTEILHLLVAPPMQGIRDKTQPPYTSFMSPILISCCLYLIYRITPSTVFTNKYLKSITLVTTYRYQLCLGAPVSLPVSSELPRSVPILWGFSCLGSPSVFSP
jgi:hypothetical protein